MPQGSAGGAVVVADCARQTPNAQVAARAVHCGRHGRVIVLWRDAAPAGGVMGSRLAMSCHSGAEQTSGVTLIGLLGLRLAVNGVTGKRRV